VTVFYFITLTFDELKFEIGSYSAHCMDVIAWSFGLCCCVQLSAVDSVLKSLQEAITTAPELYGLPKQMQQLSKVNEIGWFT